ncbi:hypothetical protein EDB19DRAFT_1714426, partial [Suillus lakei]
PLMHAHSATSTVAVFNALASETWINIVHVEKGGVETHQISESGILDVFLLPGPTPSDVFTQYTNLTGTAPLPPHRSLGYHQCHWKYVGSDDVRGVQNGFDKEDFREYEEWCWPGFSLWIDFFHPTSWDFWISLFKTETIDGQWSWTENIDGVGIWNDMNEVRF